MNRRPTSHAMLVAAALLIWACDGDPASPDGGGADDAGRQDAMADQDAGDATDAGRADAGADRDGGPSVPPSLCPTGTLPDGTECPPLAFPTAMGYGRFARGGRGGEVLYVTNLDDAGEGSLRWALERSGPRVVVFEVGGTITLSSPIVIDEPFVTVAGQSAPGDGVLVRSGAILVQASDVIIRHLRVRVGDEAGESDAVSIYGRNEPGHRLRDIILDHVSASWGTDGLIDVWGRQSDAGDITVQRSVLAETLYESVHPEVHHSRAMLVGAGVERVSVLQNLFAHNNRRHPHFSSGAADVDIVNNVVYGYGQIGIHYNSGDSDAPFTGIQVVHNYFRESAESTDDPLYEDWHYVVSDDSTIHVAGNLVDRPGGVVTAEEASDCYGDPGCSSAYRGPSCTGFCLSDALLRPVEGMTPLSATEAWETVVDEAGARVPARDAVDARIAGEVADRSGALVNCVAADGSERCMRHGGGWPTIESGTPPPDGDRDGMPDAWETRHGLDPADAADALGDDWSPIYTNVEVYLNERAGDYTL